MQICMDWIDVRGKGPILRPVKRYMEEQGGEINVQQSDVHSATNAQPLGACHD
jgi:hypothetical protein